MSEERIVFATANEGKMKEVRQIFKGFGREVTSMKEAGADLDIIEDGLTFGDNAQIKARAVWAVTGGLVLADDSGLVVDCLNGEPGVYSARYMGENTSYEIKNQTIIHRVDEAGGDRKARFICNIAAMLPDGRVLHTEEVMEGVIAKEPAGTGGFGYDPILFLPELGVTSAELSEDMKNRLSHRGKALEAMRQKLRGLDEGGLA